MACFVAKAYKIALYPTIAEALCLGGKQLAVDAVLSIGEFGNYPVNAKGQREYPRKRFFDDIVDVFQRNGRVCRSSTTSICRIAGIGPSKCMIQRSA